MGTGKAIVTFIPSLIKGLTTLLYGFWDTIKRAGDQIVKGLGDVIRGIF